MLRPSPQTPTCPWSQATSSLFPYPGQHAPFAALAWQSLAADTPSSAREMQALGRQPAHPSLSSAARAPLSRSGEP